MFKNYLKQNNYFQNYINYLRITKKNILYRFIFIFRDGKEVSLSGISTYFKRSEPRLEYYVRTFIKHQKLSYSKRFPLYFLRNTIGINSYFMQIFSDVFDLLHKYLKLTGEIFLDEVFEEVERSEFEDDYEEEEEDDSSKLNRESLAEMDKMIKKWSGVFETFKVVRSISFNYQLLELNFKDELILDKTFYKNLSNLFLSVSNSDYIFSGKLLVVEESRELSTWEPYVKECTIPDEVFYYLIIKELITIIFSLLSYHKKYSFNLVVNVLEQVSLMFRVKRKAITMLLLTSFQYFGKTFRFNFFRIKEIINLVLTDNTIFFHYFSKYINIHANNFYWCASRYNILQIPNFLKLLYGFEMFTYNNNNLNFPYANSKKINHFRMPKKIFPNKFNIFFLLNNLELLIQKRRKKK